MAKRDVLKDLELVEDEGIEVRVGNEKIRARCKYLGLKNGKIVACIDETNPYSIEPTEKLLISYSRIRGARYAIVVAGDIVRIYDVVEKREVDRLSYEDVEVKASEKDYRIVAAYYPLIHCSCEVEKCEL